MCKKDLDFRNIHSVLSPNLQCYAQEIYKNTICNSKTNVLNSSIDFSYNTLCYIDKLKSGDITQDTFIELILSKSNNCFGSFKNFSFY